MPDPTAIRRGVSNEGGFFSPYYLFDLMRREHGDELDIEGRDRERRELPRVFHKALAALDDDSPVGQVWTRWYGELFEALGLRTQAVADGIDTPRHGRVPVSHLAIAPGGAPLALLDVHRLGADLDRDTYIDEGRDGDLVTTEPIARGFEMALDAQDTRWGLLTNGREVRLYRKGANVARQFLRVDFRNLFDADRDDEWTAFWGLFRAAAFVPGDGAKCLLDLVLEGSQRHASRIAEDLRENVVTAVEALIQGVLDEKSNAAVWGGGRPDRAALERLFEESLNLLYRLLFLLYAESRDVLPVAQSRIYRDTYSVEHLRDLAERDAAAEDAGKTYYIESLRTLFRLLRTGFKHADLEIPALGGRGLEDPAWERIQQEGDRHLVGLFDGRRTLWLDRCRIPDAAMRTVIRELSLSRSKKKTHQRQRYSYADLGVDQLGSIYEGLLVYEPAVLTEETVLAKVSGELRLVTRVQAEANQLDVLEESLRRPGQFVLRLWGGRRKGSGSYYTPHEITSFLVKEALAPKVDGVLRRAAEAGAAERRRAEEEASRTGTFVLHSADTRIAEEVLDIRVCDPAMGSGAFLIQACRYLAEAYGRALIAEGRDDSGRIEPAELVKYKRLVAERCLYGVDLNPLAVELAKVSIWLETLSSGRPLSFLDAHFRCGNSLVGAPLRDREGAFTVERVSEIPAEALKVASDHATPARIADAGALTKRNTRFLKHLRADRARGQSTLFGLDVDVLRKAMDAYVALRNEIETAAGDATGADGLAARERQEARFREAYEGAASPVRPLRTVCDLWCAAWFWPEEANVPGFETEDFQHAVKALLADQAPEDRWYPVAKRIALEQRFFHWELEFPEVFVRTKPGFDAVLGNPPWNTLESDAVEMAADWDVMIVGLRGAERDARMAELLADGEAGASIRRRVRERAQYARACGNLGEYGRLIAGKVTTFAPFTVVGWLVTRREGALAYVLKDAFHLTESLGPIRAEILENGRIEVLATSDNERKVFDAHNQMRFDLVLARRGLTASSVPISVHRFRTAQEIVDAAGETIDVPVEFLLDEAERPSDPIPEIVDLHWSRLLPAAKRAATRARWGAECNASTDKDCWNRGARPVDTLGPVLAMVGPFHAFEYEPMAWLRADAREHAGFRKILWGRWRVAVRDRADQKNERVLIGAVVPPDAATCHYLNLCRDPNDDPRMMLLLVSLANSLVLDALARPLVGIHMSSGILNKLPWALRLDHPHAPAILRDAAALVSVHQAFEPLVRAAGLTATAPLTPVERAAGRARVDARVGLLYEFGLREMCQVLGSFRLLDQDQPALDGEPKSFITRDLVLLEFCRATGVAPPADVVALYADAGVDIADRTGPVRDLEMRVAAATELGAIAYVPARKRGRGDVDEVE